MVIVEQFLKSKTNIQSECEDSIFISDNYAAVIDGATSKSSRKYNNELSGRACSQLLKNALGNLAPKSSVGQTIKYLSETVLSLYKNLGLVEHLKKNPLERASASIIIFSKYRNEIWMVGDCQCLVDKTHYTNKKSIDDLLSNIRSFYIQSEFVLGKTFNSIQETDPGREYILPLLQRQTLFQNSPKKGEFTYGVIDGFKVPKTEIKVIKLSKPEEIVLASDGYPKLYPTLKQSESYLNKLIKADPLFYQEYKSTKGLKKGYSSFDDRAFLKVCRV